MKSSILDTADKATNESLLQYAQRLSENYVLRNSTTSRKGKGQYFTPLEIGEFMASLFTIRHGSLSILDPGAGTGILTAAFCDRVLSTGSPVHLRVEAYENDTAVIPILTKLLGAAAREFKKKESELSFVIHEDDFVTANAHQIKQPDLFGSASTGEKFDYVIANPPYFKIAGESRQARAMDDVVAGQPNIYSLFLALGVSLLKPDGEIVFISPRSFCSGLYFRRFRQWLLSRSTIRQIHSFQSRVGLFEHDSVLQENVIFKLENGVTADSASQPIKVTVSKDKDFSRSDKLHVDRSTIIFEKNGDVFIRVPASLHDLSVIRAVDSWPFTLNGLGFEISTGPVVAFRATEFLSASDQASPKFAPLLWSHNLQGLNVVWPLAKNGKAQSIRIGEPSRTLLLPVKNYVLLKRFTSKEQARRLYAAVLRAAQFPHELVGMENHLNYVYRPHGDMTEDEAYGLAALFNSQLLDDYFRTLNGHTQVNATEIRTMPMPTLSEIVELGKLIRADVRRNVAPSLDVYLENIVANYDRTLAVREARA
jgi:adenine-specific DNA-methyltransferase